MKWRSTEGRTGGQLVKGGGGRVGHEVGANMLYTLLVERVT